MEPLTLSPSPEDIGKRIDSFLAEKLDGFSRSRIQKMTDAGDITVNGKTVKPNYRARESDVFSIVPVECAEPEIVPEDIPLDILYEDDELIVVNKTKGMVVHPAAGHYAGTLVNALMYHCCGSLSGINGVLRPGIVHRIDKDTSGVLVAAKTDSAHASLSAQLAERSMTRVYKAVCVGNLKDDVTIIDKPIGRSPNDRKKMAVVKSGGRNAYTTITVLERFRGYCFVEARLKTGRTHQIRAHMAHIAHPILGDELYGGPRRPFAATGQTLHAAVLGFVHPSKGAYMEFSAPLPEYFERILEKLRV